MNALDANRHSALRAAVVTNNTALFEIVLQHGADIGVTDVLGQNELFGAVLHGHVCMMELLVQRGLSVNAADSSGRTPLTIAVIARQHAAAEWLLQHSVAVNATDDSGRTALQTSCASESPDDAAMVELLLASGADVNRINPKTQGTALDVCAVHGNLQCAKALIAAGADVNHSNLNSLTTLHVTIMANHAAVVQLLLEHSATAVINNVIRVTCPRGHACCTQATALMMCYS
jgi:uncharacterized protein